MAKAKMQKGKTVKRRETAKERFVRERAELQRQQNLRDAKAVRRAVIRLDDGEADSGVVENIISADEDFRIPERLLVEVGGNPECNIGGRYERGVFKRGMK